MAAMDNPQQHREEVAVMQHIGNNDHSYSSHSLIYLLPPALLLVLSYVKIWCFVQESLQNGGVANYDDRERNDVSEYEE